MKRLSLAHVPIARGHCSSGPLVRARFHCDQSREIWRSSSSRWATRASLDLVVVRDREPHDNTRPSQSRRRATLRRLGREVEIRRSPKAIGRTVRTSVLTEYARSTEADDAQEGRCYRHVLRAAAAPLSRPVLQIHESANTHSGECSPAVPGHDKESPERTRHKVVQHCDRHTHPVSLLQGCRVTGLS